MARGAAPRAPDRGRAPARREPSAPGALVRARAHRQVRRQACGECTEMRDLHVTALIFASLPYIFKRPYVGVLVWTWISFMNPHRLTWGFAFNMPFAMIVG